MKHCSKGHNNPDDAVFCAEWGEKLDQRTSELREPADLETTPTHHESKSYTTNSTGFWGNLLVIGVLIVVGYFVLGAVIKVIETIGVIFAIIF